VEVRGAVAVVTGGGSGIGQALCEQLAASGARGIVVADIDPARAFEVAGLVGGIGLAVDASIEQDVAMALDEAELRLGPVDLFCANAGAGADGGLEAPDEVWAASWQINVMSHVYAARQCVPRMLRAGRGYLLHTASAAGILTMPGAAPYAVAKHGAVAVAEFVAMTYGSRGIKVSCLCPQAVDTRLLREQTSHAIAQAMRTVSAVLDPTAVALAAMAGIREERFLILPHPEVAEHERRRSADRDRWLRGMSRLAETVPSWTGTSESSE
jgi:NAD(P)-dependent dehydrogenase (short-subunit alcohol dehydrogenase family)